MEYKSVGQIDTRKVFLYNEYRKNNEQLYQRDKQEYWASCGRYIEDKMHKWLHQGIDPLSDNLESKLK